MMWEDPYELMNPVARAWHRLWDFWYDLTDHQCKACGRWSETVGEQERLIYQLKARLGPDGRHHE